MIALVEEAGRSTILMKIVFLDIDGVLKTKQGLRRAYARHGKLIPDSWDEGAVRNLNKLTEEAGAKIVLTSTWRYRRNS